MNKGYNVFHIATVVSIMMQEIVLFPLINWKLNAVELLPKAKYLKMKKFPNCSNFALYLGNKIKENEMGLWALYN